MPNSEEIYESERRFVNIKLTSRLDFAKEVISERKQFLKLLSLTQMVMNFTALKEIVKQCENLESLCLDRMHFPTKDSDNIQLISKKLKNLQVFGCKTLVLDHFEQIQLISFELKDTVDASAQKLSNFISHQKELKSLIIKTTPPSFFLFFMTNNFKIVGESLNLKRLIVAITCSNQFDLSLLERITESRYFYRNNYNKLSDNDEENFINFLKLRRSLEETSIEGFPSENICRFMLTQLPNLRKVTIKNIYYTSSNTSEISSSPSIKELNISERSISNKIVKKLIAATPQITSLGLDHLSQSDIANISINLKNLVNLSCMTLHFIGSNAKIKGLKSLNLVAVVEKKRFIDFVTENPSLEEISIKMFVNCELDDIKDMMETLIASPNLKKIKIQGYLKEIKFIHNLFKSFADLGSMKVLELIVDNHPHENFVRKFIFYVSSKDDLHCPYLEPHN